MTIAVIVHSLLDQTVEQHAELLFAMTGAAKFGGTYAKLRTSNLARGQQLYEFSIPQAFTSQHPAIRYLLDHA